MRRMDTNDRLVIATHNLGKLREFRTMLGSYLNSIVSAGELGLPEPDETGTTFRENASLKALAAAKASGNCALADDSGLCVNALAGDPGIYSARWAGPTKDFPMAMQRVEEALQGKSDRSAYFISVLCLGWPDGETEFFEGRADGVMVWPPRGTQGHGYDPVFVPRGQNLTFGEMDDVTKNQHSHRGRVVEKLIARIRQA